MTIKIGFQKEYTLPSGYVANFWAIGNRTFLYDEYAPTNLSTPKNFKVDILLYKDQASFMSNISTGIKQSMITQYYLSDLQGGVNLVDKLFLDIKNNTVNTYFNDAIIIEVTV